MKRFLLMILFFVSLVFLPYSVYAENLITNGSFETPQVTSSENWQIFTEGYGPWVVEGKPDSGEPEHALEYQKNGIYLGSTTKDGVQYVELDGYYPVTLSQSIQSCSSGKYHVSFDYAPRPGQPENKLLVKLGDTMILDASETPGTPFAWKPFSQDVTGPTTGSVTISFQETGANDQLGMFLDNVKVECVIPPDEDKDGIIDEKDFCLGTQIQQKGILPTNGVSIAGIGKGHGSNNQTKMKRVGKSHTAWNIPKAAAVNRFWIF